MPEEEKHELASTKQAQTQIARVCDLARERARGCCFRAAQVHAVLGSAAATCRQQSTPASTNSNDLESFEAQCAWRSDQWPALGPFQCSHCSLLGEAAHLPESGAAGDLPSSDHAESRAKWG